VKILKSIEVSSFVCCITYYWTSVRYIILANFIFSCGKILCEFDDITKIYVKWTHNLPSLFHLSVQLPWRWPLKPSSLTKFANFSKMVRKFSNAIVGDPMLSISTTLSLAQVMNSSLAKIHKCQTIERPMQSIKLPCYWV
jgi:hypothetical protein